MEALNLATSLATEKDIVKCLHIFDPQDANETAEKAAVKVREDTEKALAAFKVGVVVGVFESVSDPVRWGHLPLLSSPSPSHLYSHCVLCARSRFFFAL